MYTRLLIPPKESFFLFGPRGTGKSSWVKLRFPHALSFDLLESDTYTQLLASPQRLEAFIPASYNGWIIIDEIQKIPPLLDEVHRLIEKRKLKFVLTGSSARKLKRQGVNLLAGRAFTYEMHPLTASELGGDFDLRKSLLFGHLPKAYTSEDPRAFLKSYVHTYLKEEVQQEGLTRNIAAFARFLETASFSQASILNVTAVSRECGVDRKVAEDYFSILRDLLLSHELPVFSKRAKRDLATHTKFFFFDTGVYRAIRPRGPLDTPAEIDGAAMETLVLQEMLALNSYLRLEYKIFYWRTRAKKEVDFVLYGPKGLIAIEVKRAHVVRNKELEGLKLFRKDYTAAKTYFVYGGSKTYHESGNEIIGIQDFLRDLPQILNRQAPRSVIA